MKLKIFLKNILRLSILQTEWKIHGFGFGCVLLFFTASILISCASKPIVVDLTEIGNHSGELVEVKGCLGENITLREILIQGLPLDTQSRFFNFYADCEKTSPPVVLVFEKGDPYVDEEGFITLIGRVKVTASGMVFVHIND